LAGDVIAAADAALEAVPPLAELPDGDLLAVLDRAGAALRALHGHEILAGVLRPDGGPTAAEVALHALSSGRQAALGDEDLAARSPEVVALLAPRIGAAAPLPADAGAWRPVAVADLGPREALRLRIRWVQELSARAALELGR